MEAAARRTQGPAGPRRPLSERPLGFLAAALFSGAKKAGVPELAVRLALLGYS